MWENVQARLTQMMNSWQCIWLKFLKWRITVQHVGHTRKKLPFLTSLKRKRPFKSRVEEEWKVEPGGHRDNAGTSLTFHWKSVPDTPTVVSELKIQDYWPFHKLRSPAGFTSLVSDTTVVPISQTQHRLWPVWSHVQLAWDGPSWRLFSRYPDQFSIFPGRRPRWDNK